MRANIVTLALIILILAAGGAWYWYTQRAPAPDAAGGPFRSEFLEQYRYLKNVELDVSFFSEPLFRLLEGTRSATTSPAIPAGRLNPFVAP